MENVWSVRRTLMTDTIPGFGVILLPHWRYKLTRNFLLHMLKRPGVSLLALITNQTLLGLRPLVNTLNPSLVALVLSRFFDVSLRTWILPSSLRYGILPLQSLLQSLQHQRRLMLRKPLPLRRLRLLLLFLLRVGVLRRPVHYKDTLSVYPCPILPTINTN